MNYGGAAWDEAHSVVQANNGDIVVAGFAKSQNQALWLLRLTSDGHRKWGRLYATHQLIYPESIIETKDSSFVIAGYNAEPDSTYHNLWVVKLDSVGNLIWERTYAGSGDSHANSIIQTKDNGFAIAGYTKGIKDDDTFDSWILKIDSVGNFLWQDIYVSMQENRAADLTELPDSSIVTTGFNNYDDGAHREMTLTKYSQSGTLIWLNYISLSKWDEGTSIIATSDSCLVVAGIKRYSPLVDYDAVLIKLNFDGDTLWTKILPSAKYTVNVIETYDKGYAMGITSQTEKGVNANFHLAKYDVDGKIMWQELFKRRSDDFVSKIIETQDNGILMAGSTYATGKSWDYGILKYASIDRSEIYFTNPIDSVISYTSEILEMEGCIQGYKIPKEIKVYCNNIYVETIDSFTISDDPDCDFNFKYKLFLNKGKNEVEFKVTDFKDFQFSGFRTIYYFPPPAKIW